MDGEGWGLLEVYGDPEYVGGIVRTLRFISPGHEIPPFLLEIAPSASANEPRTTETWRPDAPIFLTVTMTNNTQQVLRVPLATPGADYQLNLGTPYFGDNGWRSRYDEERLQSQREREGALVEAQKEVVLKPHETDHRMIEVGSLLMPESRPGKYSIEMQMKLPAELGPGLVRSNTVTITVSE